VKIETKKDRRERIRLRLRKKLAGDAARPRLAVFRSVAHIYVQAIDDASGTT
jgi:large subunit ribosomal protein L18